VVCGCEEVECQRGVYKGEQVDLGGGDWRGGGGDMVANFCGPWKLSGLPPFLARHKASLHTLVLGHCFGDDPISRGLTTHGTIPASWSFLNAPGLEKFR